MSENNTYEFRCTIDGSLLCKAKINSIIESKCKKCKNLYYFINGTSFLKDNNNYFKGDK